MYARSPSETPTGAVVELDMFSGRPNPVWTLDSHGVATLLTLLEHLDAADDRPAIPDRALGYRGVRANGIQDVETVFTTRGFVAVGDPPSLWLRDPDHVVELWLIATGEASQPEEVISDARSQVAI